MTSCLSLPGARRPNTPDVAPGAFKRAAGVQVLGREHALAIQAVPTPAD